MHCSRCWGHSWKQDVKSPVSWLTFWWGRQLINNRHGPENYAVLQGGKGCGRKSTSLGSGDCGSRVRFLRRSSRKIQLSKEVKVGGGEGLSRAVLWREDARQTGTASAKVLR